MFSRIADLHARWQISVMSAPEKPCVKLFVIVCWRGGVVVVWWFVL